MKRIITLIALCLSGCLLDVHPKPLPPTAKACSYDWDCPDTMHCGFPASNDFEYARCMPGHGGDRWRALGGH